MRLTPRPFGLCVALALVSLSLGCQQPMTAPPTPRARATPPSTVPELSGDRRTSSHAEVMSFLDALQAAGDPRLVRTTFGTTPEGRALPLLVVADPPVSTPQEALASGKPRVFVMANIHAGEVEGKEACLELLREIGRAHV